MLMGNISMMQLHSLRIFCHDITNVKAVKNELRSLDKLTVLVSTQLANLKLKFK